MKLPLFTMFFIERDVFIAIPVEDDGRYDAKLVYILGKTALIECKEFDSL